MLMSAEIIYYGVYAELAKRSSLHGDVGAPRCIYHLPLSRDAAEPTVGWSCLCVSVITCGSCLKISRAWCKATEHNFSPGRCTVPNNIWCSLWPQIIGGPLLRFSWHLGPQGECVVTCFLWLAGFVNEAGSDGVRARNIVVGPGCI